MSDKPGQLGGAYNLDGPEAARRFYDGWAETYDAEITENGYVTPRRCAEALARFAAAPWAPVMDLGCGTGISGLALREAGFECIDGYDVSEAMLARAEAKGVYRRLGIADLSKPLDIPTDEYQNAAAIGTVNPNYMPVTVLDEILAKLPVGGCFVFSLNDSSAADGSVVGRLNTLIDTGVAELMFREHGEHLPGFEMKAWVFVLKKR